VQVSGAKLATLDPEGTMAQRFCPPSIAADGTKFDIRVITHGTTILGLASRHFNGQARMELLCFVFLLDSRQSD
jgi:hypothetical protein